ncbi:gp53-like domain-containing protein [Pseudomonas aeruginosa]|uniref:gp53-like domain-containing protein n=1 Tax=Pseudomonas aeruginosa TaxID=287 RepID=UPI00104E2EA6|nr:hypothetical protein [Pseudomonas aeruginosa]
MANLPETPDYSGGVYQIETSDPVLGGPGGISNRQAEQLGNRTAWLKVKTDALLSGELAAGNAAKLAAPRKLSISGVMAGSASFDGGTDVSIPVSFADSPTLPGQPTAATPPLFDHGRALATTEYVRKALGSAARALSVVGDAVLDEPLMGSVLVAGSYSRNFTWTTPNMSALPTGASFSVVNLSGSTLTLTQRSAGDHYISAEDASGTATFYTVPNNTAALVTVYQPGLWLVSHVSRPTADLKRAIDSLLDGTTPAAKASRLASARQISIGGEAVGSAAFDGGSDVTISLALSKDLELRGAPTASTPPAFDRGSRMATTEYVRGALGSVAGIAVATGDTVLDAPIIGHVVVAGAHVRNSTWTTPGMASLPRGASFKVVNLSGFTVILVQRSSSDRFISALDPSGSAVTYEIPNGTSVSLTKYQEQMWLVEAQPSFPALRSSPGYQRLPSGLIMQFGTVSIPAGTGVGSGYAVLPIAFPNGPLAVSATLQYGGTVSSWFGFTVWSGNVTPTTITCSLDSGSTAREVAGSVNYNVIGF